MIKGLLTTTLVIFSQVIFAQDYFAGKSTSANGVSGTVYYDRTQFLISSFVYQTRYKILNTDKKDICSIYITHDQHKPSITISLRTDGAEPKENVIDYDKLHCGLIFCEAGSADTSFPANKKYLFLLSFADTIRDYPVLHKIRMSDGRDIELDPLSKLRIKKHNELVKGFAVKSKPVADRPMDNQNSAAWSVVNDTFNMQLFAMRDSLNTVNSHYIETVNQLRAEIRKDLMEYMKTDRIYSYEKRYEGQKRNGLPDGIGVLVANESIYDGTFSHGAFVSGKSVIKVKSGVYYGESVKDSMYGKGWLKFDNGSFWLGEFKNGEFITGISLSKDNGEVFFGNLVNGQRTGYGELRNSRGDNYYGEFLNGRLIKGYCKEVDQFGYSTYARVENGQKVTISAQLAEAFFDSVHNIKPKADTQP